MILCIDCETKVINRKIDNKLLCQKCLENVHNWADGYAIAMEKIRKFASKKEEKISHEHLAPKVEIHEEHGKEFKIPPLTDFERGIKFCIGLAENIRRHYFNSYEEQERFSRLDALIKFEDEIRMLFKRRYER